MARAIVYLRVSTEEQAESGLGLEAQESACETYAVHNGHVTDGIFRDEGVSGSLSVDKRPGLLDALAALRKGDILLVAKRDRLSRGDQLTTALIESAVIKSGARVVSAAGEGTEDDSPGSILFRRMIDAFAEYERLIIAARTRAALKAKAARGERSGGIPYGKRIDPDQPARSRKSGRPCALVADPVELVALECMIRWRSEGKSFGVIARLLNADGIPTKSGNPWRKSSVFQLIKRHTPDGQGQAS